MKKIFWIGITGIILFEFLNVYFIMPMPGSQEINSLNLAYFLYRSRWVFRSLFVGMIALGWYKCIWKKYWLPFIPVILALAAIYMCNFYMAADHMFYQPKKVIFKDRGTNQVDSDRLIIGVVIHDIAKAYPIRFMGYHHQVLDTLGGKPIIVTYCTVCRTGRVYEPIVNGKQESFRLVGMDHFNAMLEDKTTGSWWRQVTGEAIAGPLKGQRLPEVYSQQSSLSEWLRRYPNSLIMQADSAYMDEYSKNNDYETGKSKKSLTGTDSLSWQPKSWVIGVKVGSHTKAYDWNRLKAERLIHDQVKGTPVLIVLNKDTVNFLAFERPDSNSRFTLHDNELTLGNHHFATDGKGIDTSFNLKPLPAYQEFWHSWKFFNPGTEK